MMKHFFTFALVVSVLFTVEISSSKLQNATRIGKVFSIFQLVSFPNDPCIGSSSRNGTCFTILMTFNHSLITKPTSALHEVEPRRELAPRDSEFVVLSPLPAVPALLKIVLTLFKKPPPTPLRTHACLQFARRPLTSAESDWTLRLSL